LNLGPVSALIAAICFTYSAVFGVIDHDRLTWEPPAPEQTFMVIVSGTEHEAAGAVWCDRSEATIKLGRGASWYTRVHELVHLVGCEDDGLLNANPHLDPASLHGVPTWGHGPPASRGVRELG
jgi:hypothetical protein